MDWDVYRGKLTAAAQRQLADKVGDDVVAAGIESGLIGGVMKGSRRVALPLWVAGGTVGTVLLLDPSGRIEPPAARISNAEAGLADGAPVWLSSVPGGVEAAFEAASGFDLHLTTDTWHALSYVGKAKTKGVCVSISGIGAMDVLVKMICEQAPWSRPARILHWFAQELFPGQLAALAREGVMIERRMTAEETQARADEENAARQDMFVTYSGRIAVLGRDGLWREAAKGVAVNMLVERGFTPKAAKKGVDALPIAIDYRFDPSDRSRVIRTEGGSYLNEYRGMPITPESGKWTTVWRLIDHLVGNDPAGRDYFLDWLAKPLQSLYAGRGSLRTLSAIVLHGVQGTGKGWLTEILRVLYSDYMLTIGQQNLDDAFEPDRMRKLLFLVANEVSSATERSTTTLNRLKAWITEDKIPIRRMHAAADECDAHFNMLFTSNAERPVHLEGSDRRYSVFIQNKPLPPDVIAELQADKAAGWPQARYFLDHLLTRKVLREFWRPYDNKARTALMQIDSIQVFAEQLRDNGIKSMATDWTLERKAKLRRAEGDGHHAPCAWSGTGPLVFVPTKVLSEVYRLWCSSYGHREVKTAGAVVSGVLMHVPGTMEANRKHDSVQARGVYGVPLEPAPVRLSDSVETAQAMAAGPKTDLDDWFGRPAPKEWA